MEEFLNKYILLANKTNNIVFNISKNINNTSNDIINTKCTIADITKLVHFIKTREGAQINLEFNNIIEYRHDNRVYIKNTTKNEVYNYEEKHIDSFLDNGVYVTRLDIETDSIVPLSLANYDLTVEYELMTITNNQFTIEIKNYNREFYTFRIVVKKPNSKTYIQGIIEDLVKVTI